MKKLNLILISIMFCSLAPASFAADLPFPDTCPKPGLVQWNANTNSWSATVTASGGGTQQLWTQVLPAGSTATPPKKRQVLRFVAVAANTNNLDEEYAKGPFTNLLCGYSDKSDAQLKNGNVQIILQPPAGAYVSVDSEQKWFAMATAVKNGDINQDKANELGRKAVCNGKIVEQCSFKDISATTPAATTPPPATAAPAAPAATTPAAATPAPAATTPTTATPAATTPASK